MILSKIISSRIKPPTASTTNLSVVIIARNERAHLRRTLENLRDTLPADAEVLVVDDGSTDGSTRFLNTKKAAARLLHSAKLGVAGARNFGAANTSGNVLIFCDAHIWLYDDWWRPLVARLEDPSVGGAAPAIIDVRDRKCYGYGLFLTGDELVADWLEETKHPSRVPILPGCCLAMRRDVFEQVGGFDSGMICSGGVDNELCLRLWLLGYEQWIEPTVEVLHLFRREQPYPIESATILHNRLRLAMIHFSPRRFQNVVDALRQYEDFAEALALTVDSDAAVQRAQWAARRVHDDAWFFLRFARITSQRVTRNTKTMAKSKRRY